MFFSLFLFFELRLIDAVYLKENFFFIIVKLYYEIKRRRTKKTGGSYKKNFIISFISLPENFWFHSSDEYYIQIEITSILSDLMRHLTPEYTFSFYNFEK